MCESHIIYVALEPYCCAAPAPVIKRCRGLTCFTVIKTIGNLKLRLYIKDCNEKGVLTSNNAAPAPAPGRENYDTCASVPLYCTILRLPGIYSKSVVQK
jgi:hypothetical protein